jgi:hypothetical protein
MDCNLSQESFKLPHYRILKQILKSHYIENCLLNVARI